MTTTSTYRQRPPRIISRMRHTVRTMRADFTQPAPPDIAPRFFARVWWRSEFLLRKYGWKVVIAVVAYYLIRDTTLYIIIPFLIARRVLAP